MKRAIAILLACVSVAALGCKTSEDSKPTGGTLEGFAPPVPAARVNPEIAGDQVAISQRRSNASAAPAPVSPTAPTEPAAAPASPAPVTPVPGAPEPPPVVPPVMEPGTTPEPAPPVEPPPAAVTLSPDEAKAALTDAVSKASQGQFDNYIAMFSGADADALKLLANGTGELAGKRQAMHAAIKQKFGEDIDASLYDVVQGPSAYEMKLSSMLPNVSDCTLEQDGSGVKVLAKDQPLMTLSVAQGQIRAQFVDRNKDLIAAAGDLVKSTLDFYEKVTADVNSGAITKDNMPTELLGRWSNSVGVASGRVVAIEQ